MTDTRFALTDRAISTLPYASSGQYFARDSELSGFAVLVGRRRKTFVVQGDIRKGGKRQSVRIKVGEVGGMTTREARAAAKELLGKIMKGVDPRQKIAPSDARESVMGPTLRQAWERYRDAHMRRK